MTFKELLIKPFLKSIMKKGPFECCYCNDCGVIISKDDVLKHFKRDEKVYEVLVDINYSLNGISIQSL